MPAGINTRYTNGRAASPYTMSENLAAGFRLMPENWIKTANTVAATQKVMNR
jgi:hypothetical protein